MIRYTFEVCEDILEDISQLNCTLVVLETAYMAVFELCAEVVHNFLERLDLMSNAQVVVLVGVESTVDILADSVRDDLYLADTFVRYGLLRSYDGATTP